MFFRLSDAHERCNRQHTKKRLSRHLRLRCQVFSADARTPLHERAVPMMYTNVFPFADACGRRNRSTRKSGYLGTFGHDAEHLAASRAHFHTGGAKPRAKNPGILNAYVVISIS
jgi:hypothetical protein